MSERQSLFHAKILEIAERAPGTCSINAYRATALPVIQSFDTRQIPMSELDLLPHLGPLQAKLGEMNLQLGPQIEFSSLSKSTTDGSVRWETSASHLLCVLDLLQDGSIDHWVLDDQQANDPMDVIESSWVFGVAARAAITAALVREAAGFPLAGYKLEFELRRHPVGCMTVNLRGSNAKGKIEQATVFPGPTFTTRSELSNSLSSLAHRFLKSAGFAPINQVEFLIPAM